jgi:RHS repeat-associated protein
VALTQTGVTGAAASYAYDAFGQSATTSGVPYRFAGYRLDAATGLYYVHARMYSSALGRFLQPDPIGTAGGANLYAYVGNDPINLVDPTGNSGQAGDATWAVLGTTVGIGHNGGPPLEDILVEGGEGLATDLVAGAAAGVVAFLTPSPLNGGEAERLAAITPGAYGDLSGNLPPGFQANHLNQNAAYQSVIPTDEGLAAGAQGNAFTQPGTPHYDFHQSLEQFWDQYRVGGDLYGSTPTNAQYGQALQQALQASGLSSSEASYLADQAAAQRTAYGLSDTAPVPRIPGRINQVRP